MYDAPSELDYSFQGVLFDKVAKAERERKALILCWARSLLKEHFRLVFSNHENLSCTVGIQEPMGLPSPRHSARWSV